MHRDKIEYEQTSEITAIIKINGEKVSADSFKFEHDVYGIPKAIISFVDPDVHITTLDSIVIKKGVVTEQ